MKKDSMDGCTVLVSAVLMVIVSIFLNGWALSILWEWFIVPLFDVPSLAIVQAFGVNLVMRFLLSDIAKAKYDKGESKEERMLLAWFITVSLPLLFLVTGWILLRFM